MRLSCNGCRVLRKGCSESCSIRPCLQWIKSPDAQSNATVFLAKFYGRAGLLNLINAAAEDSLRPAVFRSLLYEACGRIVNPIYGSVGLLWSGKWRMCQAAVEAVLKGAPIVTVDEDATAAHPLLHNHGNDNKKPADAYPDIRHVVVSRSDNTNKRKESTTTCGNSTKKKKKNKPTTNKLEHFYSSDGDDHQQVDSDAEAASHVSQAEANHNQQQQQQEDDEEEEDQQQQQHKADLGLDLTLGFAPTPAAPTPTIARDRERDTHSKTPEWTAAAESQPGFLGFRFL